MSDTRVKQHPTLGILVGTDGHVMVPIGYAGRGAHWTLGSPTKDGYRRVFIDGKEYRVHRLVAETYIPNPENKPFIDHIDRNPLNNDVSNLRWATPSENQRNTEKFEDVQLRGWPHKCIDKKAYVSAYNAKYRTEHKETMARQKKEWHYANREAILERKNQARKNKRKTHRVVTFADGRQRWIPHEEALELLKLPRKERHL